ncbi:MAG: hypothetical protein JOZ13_05155 [Alphaproteobacteria bacterium]|nr:hypothetical protein [Alphaproteobacteria bacterium]
MPALKVFRAHLGFYDTVVATTSQKKALAAWGAGPSEFAKGFAAATKDAAAVSAALACPGVALRRPWGSTAPFKREAELPAPPKPTAAQKKRAAEEKLRHRKKAAAQRHAEKRRARADAERAKAELAEIAQAQGELERRRTLLQKKLHAR